MAKKAKSVEKPEKIVKVGLVGVKAAAAIFRYLVDRNRPYSIVDIQKNLEKDTGMKKKAVELALDTLTKEKKIMLKEYGKTKIYCALQPDTKIEPEEEEQIKQKHAEVIEVLKAATMRNKELRAEHKHLSGSATTREIQVQIEELSEAVKVSTERLTALASGVTLITAEERSALSARDEMAENGYKKRKRTCLAIIDALCEQSGQKRQQCMETYGLEDEDSQEQAASAPSQIAGLTLPLISAVDFDAEPISGRTAAERVTQSQPASGGSGNEEAAESEIDDDDIVEADNDC